MKKSGFVIDYAGECKLLKGYQIANSEIYADLNTTLKNVDLRRYNHKSQICIGVSCQVDIFKEFHILKYLPKNVHIVFFGDDKEKFIDSRCVEYLHYPISSNSLIKEIYWIVDKVIYIKLANSYIQIFLDIHETLLFSPQLKVLDKKYFELYQNVNLANVSMNTKIHALHDGINELLLT